MTRLCLSMALSASVLTGVTASRVALGAENPAADLSSVQANGSPEPIRSGLFFETSMGAFLTVGGLDSYSSAEAFLGLGVGYDIIPNLSIGVQFRLAPNVADCYGTTPTGARNCPTGSGTQPAPSTFTLINLEAKISYRIPVSERLFIPIRAFGGVTLLTPGPQPACTVLSGPSSNCSGIAGTAIDPSVGGAVGIEWATPFNHFTLGAEVSGDYVLQLGALALAVYPTVKYTF
jgi:hypothetical protein